MLSPAEKEKILQFYRSDELTKSYFYRTALDHYVDNKMNWRCTALYNYMFINYDGKVYPCEIISTPIGDIRKQAIEEIWDGSPARNWRKQIGKQECCRICCEPGAIRYSAYDGGLSYFKFLLKSGRHNFRLYFLLILLLV